MPDEETRTSEAAEHAETTADESVVEERVTNEPPEQEPDRSAADVEHTDMETHDADQGEADSPPDEGESQAEETVRDDDEQSISAEEGDVSVEEAVHAESDARADEETPAEDEAGDKGDELAEGEIPPDEAEAEFDEDEADEEGESEEEEDNKKWYVVKVQSGREDTIKNAIERRVKIDGLEEYFGQILVPVEKVTEMRNNKRVVRKKKLYPGYLMVNVEYNDKILYLFRETSGVGDFVGGSLNAPPQPMPDSEIEYILAKMGEVEPTDKPSKTVPSRFSKGDKVRVKDGTFVGMEGEVMDVLENKGAVKVELSIFDRPVPVELEYWQVDFAE